MIEGAFRFLLMSQSLPQMSQDIENFKTEISIFK